MEDLIAKLIVASPIAAALIGMSWQFLRYMRVRDKEWADTIRHMSKRMNDSQENCLKTVKENTLMMGRMAQLLETRIKQVRG
jgi:hypothetical protein